MNVEDFAELWTSGAYWLAHTKHGLLPMTDEDGVTYARTICEDDALAAAVIQRMLHEGVPVRELG